MERYETVTVQQTDNAIQTMSAVMRHFAHAPEGTPCAVSIGDVLDGPEQLVGTPIVIITVGRLRTIFRREDAVSHIDALVVAIEQLRCRHGCLPVTIARMLDLADHVLSAVEAHAELEAEQRARPN